MSMRMLYCCKKIHHHHHHHSKVRTYTTSSVVTPIQRQDEPQPQYASVSVLPFSPKYRLAQPGNYLFSLSKKIFSGSKYPKSILFSFEKGSTDLYTKNMGVRSLGIRVAVVLWYFIDNTNCAVIRGG